MSPFTLGIIVSGIFLYAGFEQIFKIFDSKNAEDFSTVTCFLWVVGLLGMTWLSFMTNAHIVFKILYIAQTVQYFYLWRLVVKVQKTYRMPVSKQHLKVFPGGRTRSDQSNDKEKINKN